MLSSEDMGIEKTTEHESGYFEDEEDEEGSVRGKKTCGSGSTRCERSVSELSSNNNDCDVTVSDCSEDNIFYGEQELRKKGRRKFNLISRIIAGLRQPRTTTAGVRALESSLKLVYD